MVIALGGGARSPETLVIGIDSLPVEVHGEQPGSAWNGYHHRRVDHPIVASAGETGDILDLRLREGQVHTADGGLETSRPTGPGRGPAPAGSCMSSSSGRANSFPAASGC